MNMRIFAFAAAALVVGIPGQGFAFDPSAEYSVHSMSQPRAIVVDNGRDTIRALGAPSQTSAIGRREVIVPQYNGFDPSAEYSVNSAWAPKGLDDNRLGNGR